MSSVEPADRECESTKNVALVAPYVHELGDRYQAILSYVDEAGCAISRAGEEASKLRAFDLGVGGELSACERADLEFDLWDIMRAIRDISRISEAHLAWFLSHDHKELAHPATDVHNEEGRLRLLDAIRNWYRERDRGTRSEEAGIQ